MSPMMCMGIFWIFGGIWGGAGDFNDALLCLTHPTSDGWGWLGIFMGFFMGVRCGLMLIGRLRSIRPNFRVRPVKAGRCLGRGR